MNQKFNMFPTLVNRRTYKQYITEFYFTELELFYFIYNINEFFLPSLITEHWQGLIFGRLLQRNNVALLASFKLQICN